MNHSRQNQFNQLKDEIHTELERNTFPSTIFNTVNNIARVINAIRDTRGVHWAQTVMDNGQPIFTPVEQQRYTELLKPYIPSILEFFEEPHDGQRGGDPGDPAQALTMQGQQLLAQQQQQQQYQQQQQGQQPQVHGQQQPYYPQQLQQYPQQYPQQQYPQQPQQYLQQQYKPPQYYQYPPLAPPKLPTTVDYAQQQRQQQAQAQGASAPSAEVKPRKPSKVLDKFTKQSESIKSGISNKWKSIDWSEFTPDVLFDKVMSTYQSINRSMNDTMEAVHYEKEVDDDPDIPIGGIPISPRFIIFLIYYILDITRIAVSVYGNETGRKLLSVIVSILDLVRGDWKKAILTFIGYYGSSPLLIGQAFKTYLTVIQMLSPTIQIKIPYFMYDSAKSMLFGILLSILQIGAPEAVRQDLATILKKLSDVKVDLDAKLDRVHPKISPRPDYFNVDFTDLNALQAVLDDPVYICSKEHRDAVENLLANAKDGAPMIQIVLSLIRYPHTRGMTKYLCDSKTKTSYVDLLVAEGLEREKKEEAIAKAESGSASGADMVTPVNSTPSAPSPKPQPPQPAVVKEAAVPAQGASGSQPFVFQSSTPTDELLPPELLHQQGMSSVTEAQVAQGASVPTVPIAAPVKTIKGILPLKQIHSSQIPTNKNKSKSVKSEYEKQLEAEAAEEVAAEEATEEAEKKRLEEKNLSYLKQLSPEKQQEIEKQAAKNEIYSQALTNREAKKATTKVQRGAFSNTSPMPESQDNQASTSGFRSRQVPESSVPISFTQAQQPFSFAKAPVAVPVAVPVAAQGSLPSVIQRRNVPQRRGGSRSTKRVLRSSKSMPR